MRGKRESHQLFFYTDPVATSLRASLVCGISASSAALSLTVPSASNPFLVYVLQIIPFIMSSLKLLVIHLCKTRFIPLDLYKSKPASPPNFELQV